MAMTTLDFKTIVSNTVAAVQGASVKLVDLTVGSILRSLIEANAAIVLWLQGLILALLATTRAASSSATDLDSWMADFGITRLPAVAATGQVTFARFTSTLQGVVPVGTLIQTGDGSQQYTITVDTTNAAYNATLGGYVMAPSVSSVNVPVVASIAGTGANASIGQINTIAQAVPGVDTVTNAAAFTNGVNAESDSALRTRFVAYIASLSKATKNAVGYAITSLQQGMNYTLVENFTYGGVSQMGYFYVVIDDGTGVPGSTLLSAASNAIDTVRPVTSTFGVFAPVVQNATVVMTATIAAGYDPVATKALVVTALKNYINSLPLGTTLAYSRLAQVAYDASPGVINITGVTLNGGTADIAATAQQVVKWLSVSVN